MGRVTWIREPYVVTSASGGDDKLRGGDSANPPSDMGLGNLMW